MRTRSVVFAMLAVVASFAATVGVSVFRLRPISNHAEDILRNAIPSVERLSEVETDLVLLGLRTNEYVDRAATSDAKVLRGGIAAIRRRITAAFESYRALPTYPGELERTDRIVADLAVLDDATETVLRDSDAGALTAATRELKATFHPRLERAAADVAAMRAFNAAYIRQRSASIIEARQSALGLVSGLAATSIVVAILATMIVVRSLRNRARVVHEHGELLAARATEMEAFAGRVAHDLRNPLAVTGMHLFAARAHPQGLPAAAHDNLRKASHQLERMTIIIDGLLDFARAGAKPEVDECADLRTVLDDVLTEVGPVAEAAHAELQVSAFPSTKVACEARVLASVLSNLLDNAVKYGGGPDVPPRISVRVDDRDRVAHVEVADNGPGLPPGSEQVVFQPFRQLSTARAGLGLGLATVKKVVEAHGGCVGVRSSPGRGSTFWFDLPKARQAGMPQQARRAS